MLHLTNDSGQEILINPDQISCITKDFIHIRCMGSDGEDLSIAIDQPTFDNLKRILNLRSVLAHSSALLINGD